MSTTGASCTPTLKSVKEAIAKYGTSENWSKPFHVVRWVSRPPTRDWLYEAHRQRKSAQRLAEATGCFVIDIREYALERTRGCLEAAAVLDPDDGFSGTPEGLQLALRTIVETLEREW